MLIHFLLLCAQQPLDLLPQPALALASWEAPAETVRALSQGEIWRRVQAGGLWKELEAQPGFGMAMFAWSALGAPVGGDPTRFVDALIGGGAAAALIARPEAEPGLLVVARMNDAEAGEECLLQIARLAKIPTGSLSGESWTLPLGEVVLAREGSWLFFASQMDWVEQARARLHAHGDTATATVALPEGISTLRARARAGAGPPGLWVWVDGAVLRANGYPALPKDLGASLFTGDLHEALRLAGWAGATLRVDGGGVRAEFLAPEPNRFDETHAPFRPSAQPVSLPKIGGGMLRGVIVRDFGAWYNARELYASEAAVAGSVEGDGNLRLLFGRDFGPEVLAWLEPQVRLLAARNPDAAGRALELELPAGAIGLQLKQDAPEGLGQGFVNAFMAAVTFSNFQSGAADEKQLLMNLETLGEDGLLYVARRPALGVGTSAPLAHNAEPALYVGADGQIWLSSSVGLLRDILAAPVEVVRSDASWTELELAPLADLLTRARGAVVAQRLLTNGGNFAAAEHFADLVDAAAGLLDGARLRIGPVDGYCAVQLEVFARAR